ncbi:ferrous iron transport protein B [Thermaurantimonas aggregans]|uniref:Ferrous iron transport protein B n=1 Tax=Thermaurantimonas aggregans TaxID=2173829 RepID=A0A401XIA6_9FLAO|nr:ferrous iron transport protein B [Thermaurantimonas aggregans]MCX8149307.1 ferrous iron transport protein B [Thermaurantimonas aggregans]GCD76704.1 ferrous iron transport protein B [Thermaurantimonas aggregans]
MLKIALAGNPNTGKTSLFNILTGLRHKVGNYPGITVEKKQGTAFVSANTQAVILDLPGTYSIHPTSADEQIVFDVLVNEQNQDHPDLVVYVAEAENLKRNLFLFSQLRDLGLPLILVINMIDKAKKKGIEIDISQLSALLSVPVIPVSTRKKIGIEELKKAIINHPRTATEPMVVLSQSFKNLPCEKISGLFPQYSYYKSWLLTTYENPDFLPKEKIAEIQAIRREISDLEKYHQREAILRYQKINEILQKTYVVNRLKGTDLRAVLDRIFIHKIFGYVIFASVLLLIFQSVFAWTSAPMDWIDSRFAMLADALKSILPPGRFTDLITDGVIPGIGGIVIFVPQIAVLIFFISLLEETGYMSRVVFLMDKIMRRYGMSGKSVLPLVSGTACAIPAVMSTRNIENWRERLITIFVIPFTTCSARLPVYTILISLIIPKKSFFGLINLQGLVLMALYMIGFASAFAAAWVLHRLLKRDTHHFFVAELPEYQLPLPKNIFYSVWDKTKSFVLEAGKIILSISVILWFLASTGSSKLESPYPKAEAALADPLSGHHQSKEAVEVIAAVQLENSYLGRLGKAIEPVIAPLGYDWKIGIAILSSFAAREVFVGTLATIYSVGDADEQSETVRNRMRMEMRPDGTPVFNFATGISLLLFYAFAMQCMSTLAIVKRETNSWKWPLIQLVSMGTLAYIVSLIAYQILNS